MTFINSRGVTHEALKVIFQSGTISLCGELRKPLPGVNKEIVQLRAVALPQPPEGVDCMSCMVRRVQLDLHIALALRLQSQLPMIELLVRITSWG